MSEVIRARPKYSLDLLAENIRYTFPEFLKASRNPIVDAGHKVMDREAFDDEKPFWYIGYHRWDVGCDRLWFRFGLWVDTQFLCKVTFDYAWRVVVAQI